MIYVFPTLLAEFEVHSLKTSCRKKIRALLRNNIHIYKGELDVRRRKGPSAHPPSHGFTQTMTRYLSRLHTGKTKPTSLTVSTCITLIIKSLSLFNMLNQPFSSINKKMCL